MHRLHCKNSKWSIGQQAMHVVLFLVIMVHWVVQLARLVSSCAHVVHKNLACQELKLSLNEWHLWHAWQLQTMTDKSRLLADGMGHQNHAQKLSLLHVRAMHIDTHKHPGREMDAWSFAYYAYGTAGSDKSCCYPWFVCHDKTFRNQQCIARLGSPPDDESY